MEKREIKCPQCGRFTFYSTDNPSRPFCSARCKLIDLGEWADESFKIPDPTPVDINSDDFNAGVSRQEPGEDENS